MENYKRMMPTKKELEAENKRLKTRLEKLEQGMTEVSIRNIPVSELTKLQAALRAICALYKP